MTAERLEEIVNWGDCQKMVEALRPLSEGERKALSKKAAEFFKAARLNPVDLVAMDSWQQRWERQTRAALAVLGLCGWTEAKKCRPDRRLIFVWPQGVIGQVLRDRRPEWVDKWVDQALDADRLGDWHSVRILVREGLCRRPKSDRYISRMIQSLSWMRRADDPPMKFLREDSALLEDEVWGIFEADFGDEIVLYTGEFEHEHGKYGWAGALIELAATGELDRGRMLTASLDALNRKQHAANASWFQKLHEALQPSTLERIERQGKYADLLVNDVPAVVGFAVDALREIGAAGKLETEKIIAGMGTALGMRQKGHALNGVRLLKLCVNQKEDSSSIARAAAVGLEHPAAEVQRACLEILEEVGIAGVEEVVVGRAAGVAASLRGRLQPLLGGSREQALAESGPSESNGLVAEAEGLPEPWRTLAGVDAALAAYRSGHELAAADGDPMQVPRLDPKQAIVPIGTLDELLERLSAAIEKSETSVELELLMDGMSRLLDRPADIVGRTSPLLHRATTLLGPHVGVAARTSDPQMTIRSLARAWILREDLPWQFEEKGSLLKLILRFSRETKGRSEIGDFLVGRMAEVASGARGGTGGVLLALPTHASGWIDPRELTRRVESRQGGLPRFDFIQAILRLAPEHRAEALNDAVCMPGEEGAALRYALGGRENIGKDSALWIAAARSRSAWGEFAELERNFGRDLGPDAAKPAVYSWRFEKSPRSWELALQPRVTIRPSLPLKPVAADHPTVLRNDCDVTFWAITNVAAIRCEASVWPANQEAFFAKGAMSIASRLDNPASTWSPTAQYLEPLFDQDVPVGPMARLALCFGILSKDAGARGMAIDALITVIGDGRCVGSELGSTLAEMQENSKTVLLNRVAGSLVEVSRVGSLHQYAGANLVEAFLLKLMARQAEPPADLHHLLAPLHEWLSALGSGPKQSTRDYLQQVKAGGKTKSLVKALVAMTANPCISKSAALGALQGRVERARRWIERA
jgi:hypothetical protein